MSDSDFDAVSIFAIPRAFEGHIGVIQRNAIRSWQLLQPECEILLLGTEEGTREIAAEAGLDYVPDVNRNDHGTPLVDDLFRRAEEHAAHSTLCYINTDIILPRDFPRIIQQVRRKHPKFLMVGRRIDLDVTAPLSFSAGWAERLWEEATRMGRLRSPLGSDYFVYPRGLWPRIPRYAIGRTAWDNWLIRAAVEHGAVVIDATRVAPVIHQNHSYGPFATRDAKVNSEEAQANRKLAIAAAGDEYRFTLKDATHVLTPRGIRPARWNRIRYPVWRITRTWPILRDLSSRWDRTQDKGGQPVDQGDGKP